MVTTQWGVSSVWWRGYVENNHGFMGWAVAVADLVAGGARGTAWHHELNWRVRRWLP